MPWCISDRLQAWLCVPWVTVVDAARWSTSLHHATHVRSRETRLRHACGAASLASTATFLNAKGEPWRCESTRALLSEGWCPGRPLCLHPLRKFARETREEADARRRWGSEISGRQGENRRCRGACGGWPRPGTGTRRPGSREHGVSHLLPPRVLFPVVTLRCMSDEGRPAPSRVSLMGACPLQSQTSAQRVCGDPATVRAGFPPTAAPAAPHTGERRARLPVREQRGPQKRCPGGRTEMPALRGPHGHRTCPHGDCFAERAAGVGTKAVALDFARGREKRCGLGASRSRLSQRPGPSPVP